MCGRFCLTSTPEAIAEFFGFKVKLHFESRFNISPGQPILVVRQNEGHLEPGMLHWGLIPHWAKDPAINYKMINARSETVAEKPSFRSAYKSRRCLIPADGFYEWKKEGTQKQPYYFHRTDNQFFCFAGLWEYWSNTSAGQDIASCTIITTKANQLMQPIHHRMPVVVSPDYYKNWLSGSIGVELFGTDDWPEFESYPVSTYVNNAHHEGPDCINPPEQEKLF